MKSLRKIIALFLLIFITGIVVTIVSIKVTLKKTVTHKHVQHKDSVNTTKKSF